MMGVEDGIVYLIIGEILATQVYAEPVELARHLCLQLEIGRIATLVVKLTTAIQPTRHVELPQFERRLVLKG